MDTYHVQTCKAGYHPCSFSAFLSPLDENRHALDLICGGHRIKFFPITPDRIRELADSLIRIADEMEGLDD